MDDDDGVRRIRRLMARRDECLDGMRLSRPFESLNPGQRIEYRRRRLQYRAATDQLTAALWTRPGFVRLEPGRLLALNMDGTGPAVLMDPRAEGLAAGEREIAQAELDRHLRRDDARSLEASWGIAGGEDGR